MDTTTLQLIESTLGVKGNIGAFVVTWAVLNWLGSRVKRMPAVSDDLIPLVLSAFGSVLYVGLEWLLTDQFNKASLVIGFITGFVAVGAHQFFTRTKSITVAPSDSTPPTP